MLRAKQNNSEIRDFILDIPPPPYFRLDRPWSNGLDFYFYIISTRPKGQPF
jgi:hypothetical protein